MKNKTILGMWCTNSNYKFIDRKHIQIELTANIWYSYDNNSKTDVISKEICFVKEIDFNELNDEVEIIEENKIPEKLDIKIQNETTGNAYITNEQGTKCYLTKHSKIIAERLNQVIDYLKSKGE